MLSKSAIFAAAASSVSAALLSPASTTYAAATHANYGCRRCILEGFKYCEDNDLYSRASTVTTTGKCVNPQDTNCPSGSSTISITTSDVSELVILKCAQPSTTCGTNDWTVLDDFTSAAVTVAPSGTIAQYQQCSWALKTKCGAPIVKKSASSTGETYLIHYTLDDRLSKATDNNSNSVNYPVTTQTLNDLDTNCPDDTSINCSGKSVQGGKVMFRKQDTNPMAPMTLYMKNRDFMAEQITYFDTYKVVFPEADPIQSIFKMLYDMMNAPTSEPQFAGLKWAELTSMGGWGDLSQQTIAQASTDYYEFGVYGPSSTDPKTNGDPLAMDLNDSLCQERVAIVMVYNPTSSALSTASQTFSFSAGPLNELSTTMQVPSYQTSAMAIGAGLASTAALALLF